jgi:bifunctional UDP-N-acetylglucosamine pyrophosphorylase/glucosamine-1-phosphate N-acetyltransferase
LRLSGIILAAGKGTRMVSDLPKALQPVCGLPLTEHCIRAMRGCGVDRPIVVIGHQAERVREALGDENLYAEQTEQLGTGHAAMQALPALRRLAAEHALLMPGDAPLMTSEALAALYETHVREQADVTLAVSRFDDPTGYGRIIRNAQGQPVDIAEEKDCTPEQRAIKEVCTSFYCFRTTALQELLPRLDNDNAQREYYLTDIIRLASEAGRKVATWPAPDPSILVGVNDRWQLADAAKVLRMRKLRDLAMSGVTVVDPETTFIDTDVEVGTDTVVHPSSYLHGSTRIGSGCEIGPGTRLVDSVVGDRATILSSNVVESRVGSGTRVGPYANLRPGAEVGDDCSIGDFVEIKNSRVGHRVSIGHIAYVGDAEVGDDTNIGAGTITCNFDGKKKSKTVIGKGAFIGSNNTLVAPVTIGDGAFTAAGSTITEDVPPDALGLGRARQTNREGWAARWRNRR